MLLKIIAPPPLHKFQRPKSKGFVAVIQYLKLNIIHVGPNSYFSAKYYTN